MPTPDLGDQPDERGNGDRTGLRARIRQSRFGTLAVLAITTLLVMAGAYLVNRPDKAADDEAGGGTGGSGVTAVELTGAKSGKPPAVGRAAQDFSATTIDGQKISLSAFRGKPVWLTFGATWCASCRAEAPDIQAAYEKAKASGAAVIAVQINEGAGDIRAYGERLGLTYLHVADPDTRVASAYRVLGVPAHFFIDRSGVVRSIQHGVLPRDRMDATLADISR